VGEGEKRRIQDCKLPCHISGTAGVAANLPSFCLDVVTSSVTVKTQTVLRVGYFLENFFGHTKSGKHFNKKMKENK
jgi:hypothetical protein